MWKGHYQKTLKKTYFTLLSKLFPERITANLLSISNRLRMHDKIENKIFTAEQRKATEENRY